MTANSITVALRAYAKRTSAAEAARKLQRLTDQELPDETIIEILNAPDPAPVDPAAFIEGVEEVTKEFRGSTMSRLSRATQHARGFINVYGKPK